MQAESGHGQEILPVQCKMARAALGFGIRDLAEASQTSTDTVLRFERGETLRPRTVTALRQAFEAAGIEFLPDGGVRLREPGP